MEPVTTSKPFFGLLSYPHQPLQGKHGLLDCHCLNSSTINSTLVPYYTRRASNTIKHTIQLVGSCGCNPHSVDVADNLGLSIIDKLRGGPTGRSDGGVVTVKPVLDLGGGVGRGGKGHPGHDNGRVYFT